MTNPLSHALDDAANGPEARAYTVPVATVRRLARRRRAWRTTCTAALALVLVVGGGGAVQAAITALRDTGHASSGGDWPAQFGRCGQAADGLLPDTGAASVQVSTVVTVSGEATVLVSTVVDLPDDPGAQGWVYGTDLSVVQDGVVVGVQEGAQVPDVADAVSYDAGATYRPASFPQSVVVRAALVSCEQYPSGTGQTTLATGSYTLVVTPTVGYIDTDGVTRAARASAQTPLVEWTRAATS